VEVTGSGTALERDHQERIAGEIRKARHEPTRACDELVAERREVGALSSERRSLDQDELRRSIERRVRERRRLPEEGLGGIGSEQIAVPAAERVASLEQAEERTEGKRCPRIDDPQVATAGQLLAQVGKPATNTKR